MAPRKACAQDITTGLIGHWDFEDGSGTTLTDRVGGDNATLYNMDPATDWVPGKFGTALDFDGSNDYAEFPTTSTGNFGTDDFTVSVWANASSDLTSSYHILSKTLLVSVVQPMAIQRLGTHDTCI